MTTPWNNTVATDPQTLFAFAVNHVRFNSPTAYIKWRRNLTPRQKLTLDKHSVMVSRTSNYEETRAIAEAILEAATDTELNAALASLPHLTSK